MKFEFRPQLLEEVKSYASHTPEGTEDILDCSLGVNPYGYTEAARKALESFDIHHLMDYPHSHVLDDALCSYWGAYHKSISADQIFYCNGSVSGLYYINNIFSQTPCCDVVGFQPTFTDMVESVKKFGMNYIAVPFERETGLLNCDSLIAALTDTTAFVYIDRPNNPTGQTIPLPELVKVLNAAKENGCYVLIDEAYGDFIPREESAIALRDSYDNLLVLKTFSKGFGLANLRCGYVLADTKVVSILSRTSNPYGFSDLRREVCAASLSCPDHPVAHAEQFAQVKKQIRSVIGNRLEMLTTDDRVPICTLHEKNGEDLQLLLLKKGVLTVSGGEFEELDASYVRLRVPTLDLASRLVSAIEAVDKSL